MGQAPSLPAWAGGGGGGDDDEEQKPAYVREKSVTLDHLSNEKFQKKAAEGLKTKMEERIKTLDGFLDRTKTQGEISKTQGLKNAVDYMIGGRPGDMKITYKCFGHRLFKTSALWLIFLQIVFQWSGQDWFNAVSGINSTQTQLNITTSEDMEKFISLQQKLFFSGMAVTSLIVASSSYFLPTFPRQKVKHYFSYVLLGALIVFLPVVTKNAGHFRLSVLINKTVEGIICAVGFANNESDLVNTMGRRLLTEMPAFAAAVSALGVGVGTQTVGWFLSHGTGNFSPLVTFPILYAILNFWITMKSWEVYEMAKGSFEVKDDTRRLAILKELEKKSPSDELRFFVQHWDALRPDVPKCPHWKYWIKGVAHEMTVCVFDISQWEVIPTHGEELRFGEDKEHEDEITKHIVYKKGQGDTFKMAEVNFADKERGLFEHAGNENAVVLPKEWSNMQEDVKKDWLKKEMANSDKLIEERKIKVVTYTFVQDDHSHHTGAPPTNTNASTNAEGQNTTHIWAGCAKAIGLFGSVCALIQIGDMAATTHLHLEHSLGLTASESSSKVANLAIGGIMVYGLTFVCRALATSLGLHKYLQNVIQMVIGLGLWFVATKSHIGLLGMELEPGRTFCTDDQMAQLKSLTYGMSGFLSMSPSLKTMIISTTFDINEFQHLFAIQGFAEESGKFLQTIIEPLIQDGVHCDAATNSTSAAATTPCNKVSMAATDIANNVLYVIAVVIVLSVITQVAQFKASGDPCRGAKDKKKGDQLAEGLLKDYDPGKYHKQNSYYSSH